MWQGVDGSRVLAHFPPENTYNSSVDGNCLRRIETDYKDVAVCGEALSLFGIGNGGGGPKEEHLERARRAANCNGFPRYEQGFAQPVLDRMLALEPQLDTWVGELYLEVHRGTLTTQAWTKRLMRRAEEALRACEMICAAAGVEGYPQAELDALWKLTLVNQFHDIIPGSSIHRVYEQTEAELRQVIARCRELAEAAAARLLRADTSALTLFNPSSTAYDDCVLLPEGWAGASLDGNPLHVQGEGDANLVRVLVPPRDFLTLRRAAARPAEPRRSEALVLENDCARYEFDADLRLLRGWDKHQQREICSAPGNALSLYDDRPVHWDAWDIDEFYVNCRVDSARALGPVAALGGGLRQGLRARLAIGGSTLEQTVWLRPGSARLDFVTTIDWCESHKMLRVAFPTTVHADTAGFEIQYATVQRPARRNTMWDAAKFECVGLRFADLSEADWGVALLNDGKYGHLVRNGVLDLNLLRSPTHPDPVADRGHQVVTYSLLPHAGDLAHAEVVWAEAAMLNQGLSHLPALAADGAVELPVTVEGAGIELSVLKKAEEDDALIVRLHETRGRRARGMLRAPGARIVPCNLVEWEDDEAAASSGSRELALAPFEIVTFKLR
jgi:alpha-mannosidase